MVIRDVSANKQDDVGGLHIRVRAGWAIRPKRELVAGYRGGHAERSVAIEVTRAKPKLHKFAECVELFGYQLAGADHSQRVASVLQLNLAEVLNHGLKRFVPGNR